MADPSYAERGTLDYNGATGASSLESTISNVVTGDLLFISVAREYQANITGVACSSPALTFTRIGRAVSGTSGFCIDLWAAIATQDASSMVITASYSDSAQYGAMFSMRYSAGGVTSITPHQSIDHDTLQSASTDRTIGNIVTTVRTLLLAVGCDWDYYRTHTAAANWTKRVDSQTFGTDSTTQFWHERIANSGTYPSGNFATAGSDQYIAILVALEVTEDEASLQYKTASTQAGLMVPIIEKTPHVTIFSSQNISQSISVPSGTNFLVLAAAHYHTTDGNDIASASIDGSAITIRRQDSVDAAYGFTSLGYRVNPSIGNKTLAVTWDGTRIEGAVVYVYFYSGVDTSNPISASGGQQAIANATTGSLAANAGGAVVAIAYSFAPSGPVIAWASGITEQDQDSYNSATGSYAHNLSLTGAITVTVDSGIPMIVVTGMTLNSESAPYQDYVGEFTSLGWVKIKVLV